MLAYSRKLPPWRNEITTEMNRFVAADVLSKDFFAFDWMLQRNSIHTILYLCYPCDPRLVLFRFYDHLSFSLASAL
jgi:hypothetical protein